MTKESDAAARLAAELDELFLRHIAQGARGAELLAAVHGHALGRLARGLGREAAAEVALRSFIDLADLPASPRSALALAAMKPAGRA